LGQQPVDLVVRDVDRLSLRDMNLPAIENKDETVRVRVDVHH
jgi:hypothetical protein